MWRPRLQISLRLLFLLTALLAVWMAYFGTLKSQKHSEVYAAKVKLMQQIDMLRERRNQSRAFAADKSPENQRYQRDYAEDIKEYDNEIAAVQSQLDALDH